jgi:hypothetical protein
MEQRKKPVLGQIPVVVTELKRQEKENLCSLKKRRFLDNLDTKSDVVTASVMIREANCSH